jgi:hypothetical protein
MCVYTHHGNLVSIKVDSRPLCNFTISIVYCTCHNMQSFFIQYLGFFFFIVLNTTR